MSLTRPEINVHPSTSPASALKSRVYDVIVIGGGPAGQTTAQVVKQGGLKTLLIESELIGGECRYWACVPSKSLLRAAESIEGVKAVGGARERLNLLAQKYGVAKPAIDLEGLWARRDMFTNDWKDDDQLKNMHSIGVDVVHGFARLSGVKRVENKDWHSGEIVELEARHAVIIATGSAPIIPAIEGLQNSKYWTPREAVSARKVPEHLIILGAGVVGAEMATAYVQMGSKVTLIGKRMLPKMVPEAGKMVAESLVEAGADVRLGVEVIRVDRTGESISCTLRDGNIVEGTELLIATGRTARTAGMMLDRVGVANEGPWIEVDDSMCVSSVKEGWLYAVGDPNGRALMTHIAKYQAKVAGHSIVAKVKGTYRTEVAAREWSKLSVKPKGLAIAQAIFTDPQIAAAGLTPDQATARGIKHRVVSAKMSGPGVWLHADGYQGWAQWVINDQEKLVGATFVGRDAVELLQASTMAIVGGMTLEQIWHVTPPFPTMSEIYTILSEAAEV